MTRSGCRTETCASKHRSRRAQLERQGMLVVPTLGCSLQWRHPGWNRACQGNVFMQMTCWTRCRPLREHERVWIHVRVRVRHECLRVCVCVCMCVCVSVWRDASGYRQRGVVCLCVHKSEASSSPNGCGTAPPHSPSAMTQIGRLVTHQVPLVLQEPS
jgi:hypothetical protein